MKISTLVAALMPTFSKETLETEYEELEKMVNQLNQFLQGTVKQLNRYDFSTKFVEGFEDQMALTLKVKKFPNFLGYFDEIVKRMRDQLPVIGRLVEEYFEDDVSVHALNLQRVNLLQYIPIMMFITRYIRTFTNYAIGLEINSVSDSAEATYDLIPAESAWLAQNRQTFMDSAAIVVHRGNDIEKIFEALPDVSIDPQNAKIVEKNGSLNPDPMGFGIIPLGINPFFLAGKIVVNFQTERYHLARAELDMLERKVYNLRMINEGRNDAKLQREIQYTENVRINPLKEKIADWEREYVHNN